MMRQDDFRVPGGLRQQGPRNANQAALVSQLGGAGMQAPMPQSPMPQEPAAQRTAGTSRLMETTSLMGDPAQMAKSPKAAFLSNADKYGYGELDKLLTDLQANPDYGRFFQGWQVGGSNKDLLQFNGDPSTLAPEWGGVTSFDVIGNYDPATGTAQGWRWGVGEGRGGGAPQSQPVPRAMPSAGGLNGLLTGDPMSAIQAAIAQYSKPSSNLEALLAQLGGQ